MSLQLPPLSLYIHLPWCVRKCPYCDFNSHELDGALLEDQYVDALLADLQLDLPLVWGRPVVSIFIGGGTPSLFSPAAFDRLLSGVKALLQVRPAAEVTMEANPGTVEHGPFADYLAAGINRLSFGVQSFADAKLKSLGRIHSSNEARTAIDNARAAGFDNINIDLMYGLPEQTVTQALADLHSAIELQPSHISHYQLTLEPNTVFAKYPPALPDDDTRWTMQDASQTILAEAGFRQYEVSAYATTGHQCQHNLNYWRFGDYLGIGAGAHGKITDGAEQVIRRRAKLRHPQRYLAKAGSADAIGETRELASGDRQFEFVLNALRLNDGFAVNDFTARTGLEFDLNVAPWAVAAERGLLEIDSGRVRPSETGRRFLNDLTELFLPDAAD